MVEQIIVKPSLIQPQRELSPKSIDLVVDIVRKYPGLSLQQVKRKLAKEGFPRSGSFVGELLQAAQERGLIKGIKEDQVIRYDSCEVEKLDDIMHFKLWR